MNNNKEIVQLIEERLEMGKKEYKQEIDVNDGREWIQEAIEETLDACVYLSAKLIQIKNKIGKE